MSNNTISEVLELAKESDVKFIQLSFCDLFGFQKNISIMADELESAFESGVSFYAHAILGFRDLTRSDLLLFPDPATFTVCPWRPGSGRVARFYCDIKNPDGSGFPRDCRAILRRAVEGVGQMGYICKIGAECEFYLFKTGEDGEPTLVTLDRGGYLDMPPLDCGEDIRREICLTLEEMGLKPETSHHEQGPGQNEVDFKFSEALVSADNFLTFKSVVKTIAARNGLFASFMPKPIASAPGNGLHLNLSLSQNGFNIFKNENEGHSKVAESFIAGIISRIPEITVFLNPLANSYERFGKFEAPKYLSWSHQNRSQLIRMPAAKGPKVRMELRSPDPALNPYLAISLVIAAGADGIARDLALQPPIDADLFSVEKGLTETLAILPDTLDKAISFAENSYFIKNVIGEGVLSKYLAIKRAEADDFAAALDKEKFYKERYFSFI